LLGLPPKGTLPVASTPRTPLDGLMLMPRRNSPSNTAELFERQARAHAQLIARDWPTTIGPDRDEWPDIDTLTKHLARFLIEHPLQPGTQEMAGLHEGGHVIGYERIGMLAASAEIHGSAFNRYGWGGSATPINRAARLPPYLDPNEFRAEAISALAGPVAEELFGDGDALSSIGEVIAGFFWAMRAAQLEDKDDLAAMNEAVTCAISLAEQYEAAIRKIAELLARKKRIGRWQPSIRKILLAIPQGPFSARPLSVRGQTLFDKIAEGCDRLAVIGREQRR
jgi:hypothetical protein